VRPTRAHLAAALLVAGMALAGCGSGGAQDPAPGAAVRLVATTPVVADFARTVGGDRVAVTQVIKPGVDPHDYEPSPADLRALSDADLVVQNGLGLEAWLADTVSAAGYAGPLVDSSQGLAVRRGPGGEGDPHIWHDPRNAQAMVRTITAALVGQDPAGRSTYEANAAAYTAKLAALDRAAQAKIDSIPPPLRKLVTDHDAFGYYCARYGLTFVGSVIPSFDTSAELSGRQLSDLVAKVRAAGVKAVFSEASLPPRTVETVAREAGVQVVGGEGSLYADGLGPAGSPGATYLGAEQHNTDTIVRALGGRV
jgi:zinc/manganese transport system substrate-binding protein/manganese/iron transport system substrate-binding protein